MKYDVVIRCKNEIEWLPEVLLSIKNQSVKPSKIVVVDNSSNDGSLEYAEQEGCAVVKYDKDIFNYSYALNLGFKSTTEEEILVISAHCVLFTNESVQTLIETRQCHNAAAVYGRQIPTTNSNPIDTRDLLTVFGRERIVYESHPFFHNAFSLIERSAWKESEFNEKQNGVEDRFWAKEQALRGRKIVYEPEAIVYHEHGLNQGASMDRAMRVCKSLEELHKDDIFTWPDFN